ncbi:MAG: RNA methyltransferase [Candidatus Babeliales bacterium]
MKQITSRQNPEIIAVSKLKNAKGRSQQNRFIAEGLRTCSALVKAGLNPLQIYVTEPNIDHVRSLVSIDYITETTSEVLDKISQTKTPSGIIGVFPIKPQPQPSKLSEGIVLAQITDPGNMGTLIRTCAAMDKKSVVIIDGVDPWNAKVIQASAGAIAQIDIFQWTWQELLHYKKNLNLIGLIVHGGKSMHEINTKNALLVIGSEAQGIPTEWLSDCDQFATLAMPGGIESLNAAVAGSIAMYLAWANQ